MSGRPGNLAIQDRTRAAILEAAARHVADEGLSTKLDDVAESAGVSRATLYRYFSSRDELLQALIDAAYGEVIERVRDARIDDVAFPEAFARLSRAVAHAGMHYVVLQNDSLAVPMPHLDEEFERAMDNLFERGKIEGSLRAEVATPWLRAAFRGIAVEAMRHSLEEGLGVEEAAALLSDQFLAGAAA
jgi:AcrR family transcriptional regulator